MNAFKIGIGDIVVFDNKYVVTIKLILSYHNEYYYYFNHTNYRAGYRVDRIRKVNLNCPKYLKK